MYLLVDLEHRAARACGKRFADVYGVLLASKRSNPKQHMKLLNAIRNAKKGVMLLSKAGYFARV